MTAAKAELRAAGTVVTRPTPDGPEVLLVHRARYDDWSLPKGKLRPDEPFPVAAVRETLEETGHRVRLGAPAGSLTYQVKGRPKVVHFWAATSVGEPGRRSGDEVDACEWFGLEDAVATMSYDDERALALAATRLPPSVALIIARHAKAQPRSDWPADDPARPLAKRGNDQAVRLGVLLEAWAPGRVVSSPARRCLDSIEPYAARAAITVELEPLLSEEGHDLRPGDLSRLLDDLRDGMRRRGSVQAPAPADPIPAGAVLCTHRPVLPTIAEALGIPLPDSERDEALPTAGCWVVHLTASGTAAFERHTA